MDEFVYVVQACVWTSGGFGRHWRGEVTISIRADSSQGLELLKTAVSEQAVLWLRQLGETPSGKIELTEWLLKPA